MTFRTNCGRCTPILVSFNPSNKNHKNLNMTTTPFIANTTTPKNISPPLNSTFNIPTPATKAKNVLRYEHIMSEAIHNNLHSLEECRNPTPLIPLLSVDLLRIVTPFVPAKVTEKFHSRDPN